MSNGDPEWITMDSLLTVYYNSIYVQGHPEEIIFLFVSNSRYSFSFFCPKLSHMLAKGSKPFSRI